MAASSADLRGEVRAFGSAWSSVDRLFGGRCPAKPTQEQGPHVAHGIVSSLVGANLKGAGMDVRAMRVKGAHAERASGHGDILAAGRGGILLERNATDITVHSEGMAANNARQEPRAERIETTQEQATLKAWSNSGLGGVGI